MRHVDTIVVHCSATPEGRPVDVQTIRRWHLARGWSDIGYHFVIDLSGRVHTGRPIAQIGAHVAGHNAGSIGICYVGGVDANLKPKDTRTIQQKHALRELIASLCEEYPSIKTVCGHRDFAGVKKACPSFDARAEYGAIPQRSRDVAWAAALGADAKTDTIQPAFPADDTPPPSPVASTTNWAAVGGFLTSAVAALAGLDPMVAGLVVAVSAGFAWWIIRERRKKQVELGL
ncbi:N-acetylmuramoyl-L-alanine amidase [Pannonibacter tanglangensis]|uniref:Peptidoglycan recognition protein family domain-containing protein n=1 Tax=Pannonibacter tanglangensis TaxID=2750084 RepID=A0ABW9ZH81_9HYPH|nr:N-acetylmuramoyl-L-alanine amidase [Pannonibacter sp. XCT-34]NBN64121.1 hypothetical protein [Pannonibacter sp. XCT-34]